MNWQNVPKSSYLFIEYEANEILNASNVKEEGRTND